MLKQGSEQFFSCNKNLVQDYCDGSKQLLQSFDQRTLSKVSSLSVMINISYQGVLLPPFRILTLCT